MRCPFTTELGERHIRCLRPAGHYGKHGYREQVPSGQWVQVTWADGKTTRRRLGVG